MAFTPTFLYIKQHKITGLKYFGKTVKFPPVYKGSGEHWLPHLKKHGNLVETIWFELFMDAKMLMETAIKFSIENDIVNSLEWANEKPENGLDGALPGELHHFYGVTGIDHPRFN